MKNFQVSCDSCSGTSLKQTENEITSCKLCSDLISNCKKCSDKNTCTECISDSYALINSAKCEACKNVHSACTKCDGSSSTNKCTECSQGYFLKSDSCSVCPSNCIECRETDGKIQCTKCKLNYGISKMNCDRCPDNCKKCQISNGKISCQICQDKFLLNSEGSCTACPNNCNKCKFGPDKITVVCFPSKCAQNFGFDDVLGSCFFCGDGCRYCKKTTFGPKCIKCSSTHAPKLDENSNIENCLSCSSIENCDICEVIEGKVQCKRSGCASKSIGTNKKFSFLHNDCSESCPTDTGCASQSNIHDENELCYCRNCPVNAHVLLTGPNAGVCKNCADNCELCELNEAKDDVICKSCKGNRQWVTVEVGSPVKLVQGCFGMIIFKKKFAEFLRCQFFYQIAQKLYLNV